jgi:putative membrane protein
MRFWGKLAGVACVAILTGNVYADDKKLTDNDFVDKVSSSGRVEIALARVAQVRATSEEVRKFAAKMEEDHGKLNNDLILIVSEHRIAIPERPLPEHEKHLMHFQSNEVKDFNKEYMKLMVDNHEKSVKMFTAASKELKNEALKKFAEKYLPVIKEHLTMAKKVNDQLASSK